MGLDVSGHLVIGEKVFYKSNSIEVIRYDQKTGAPYKILETEWFWVYSDGSKVLDKKSLIFNYDYKDQALIGKSLGNVDLRSGKFIKEIQIPEDLKGKSLFLFLEVFY